MGSYQTQVWKYSHFLKFIDLLIPNTTQSTELRSECTKRSINTFMLISRIIFQKKLNHHHHKYSRFVTLGDRQLYTCLEQLTEYHFSILIPKELSINMGEEILVISMLFLVHLEAVSSSNFYFPLSKSLILSIIELRISFKQFTLQQSSYRRADFLFTFHISFPLYRINIDSIDFLSSHLDYTQPSINMLFYLIISSLHSLLH